MEPESPRSPVPDFEDLETSHALGQEGGLFGRGWVPPEERSEPYSEGSRSRDATPSGQEPLRAERSDAARSLAQLRPEDLRELRELQELQEPEAEEEANGWEVVAAAQPSRSSSFSDSGAGDKAAVRPHDIPEDLVMGCLDPGCDSLFRPGNERRRCCCCRFNFCQSHLRGPFLLGHFRFEGHNNTIVENLGLPLKAGQIFLCFACHQRMPFPLASGHQDGPVLQPSEAAHLPNEVQSLRKLNLAGLREADDKALRRSAKALLLRLLEQLCVRLRPWTESEREWLWGLAPDLVRDDICWLAQFFRQVNWYSKEEAVLCKKLLESHQENLPGREALQILGALGRSAEAASGTLGAQDLGLVAKYAAQRLEDLKPSEMCCCLELLLDACHELGSAGATGARIAILGALLKAAVEPTPAAAGLCNELFWALEARSGQVAPEEEWASVVLQELLRDLPEQRELGLLRQHTWVREMERGNFKSCMETRWGKERRFPLAVWPPCRSCLGMQGVPKKADSKSAPVVVRCRFHDEASSGRSPADQPAAKVSAVRPSTKEITERRKTSGVLLKRDVGMHREQQVGQTLRLLEILIWEDPELQSLLKGRGLTFEDVRATYTIVMTGHGTAMLEYIDGARTLREVRSGGDSSASGLGTRLLFSQADRGTLLTFLRQHNNKQDLENALARLAFTAAVSAVLSFVAGLGDRHHENFMVTVDGRLVHVDFGYALGREPLDSVLIHIAVQGGRPATTLQFDELKEALGTALLDSIFWPVVRKAFLRVRQSPGLVAEMFYTALIRDRREVRGPYASRAWKDAQAFVSRNCVTAMNTVSAERFIHSLLLHCTTNERGTHLRDELKGLRLGEISSEAVSKAWQAAIVTGRTASSGTRAAAGLAADVVSAGPTLRQMQTAAKDTASDLMRGIRGLLFDAPMLTEPPR